ncbi:hypothetical protein [Leisingera caerulea]|uniref:hypothetical protein n=1 Tax=Leisingera caerulea TaxID=506591 RepID=UPI000403F7C3|nr:hypothetical protein [Leisingera caerulea]
MTALDLSPAKTAGAAPFRKLIPLLAAAALLVLFGLPALMAPAPAQNPLDWHGNSAAVQDRR